MAGDVPVCYLTSHLMFVSGSNNLLTLKGKRRDVEAWRE